MTEHGVRSKSLTKRYSHSSRNRILLEIEAEMAESEEMQTAVTQASIQLAMTKVMAMREADVEQESGGNMVNLGRYTDMADQL